MASRFPLLVVAKFDDSKPAFHVVVEERSVSISPGEDDTTQLRQIPSSNVKDLENGAASSNSEVRKFELNPVVFCALLSEISNSTLYRTSFVSNVRKETCRQVVVQLRGPWHVPIDRDW